MIFPAPKPERRAPKEKRTVKRENYARSKKEFARAFESKARVEWMKLQPCVWCRRVPSENAHTITGGRSRRADARFAVPLCRDYYDDKNRRVMGCHKKYDRHLAPFDNEETRAQVKACAPEVERLWRQSRGIAA